MSLNSSTQPGSTRGSRQAAPQQPCRSAGGPPRSQRPTASHAHARSALKFKGACSPANKGRRGLRPGTSCGPLGGEEGRRDKRAFRTRADGHPICGPIRGSRSGFSARRAGSPGAAVPRTWPALPGPGAGGGEAGQTGR